MKKRLLEIETQQRLRDIEANRKKNLLLGGDNFDHSVNTLATLANPDLDFFPTTESSDRFTDSFIFRSTTARTDQLPDHAFRSSTSNVNGKLILTTTASTSTTPAATTATIARAALPSTTQLPILSSTVSAEKVVAITEKDTDQSKKTDPPVSTHQTILNLLGNNDTNWVWTLQEGGEVLANGGNDHNDVSGDELFSEYDDDDDDEDDEEEEAEEVNPHLFEVLGSTQNTSAKSSKLVSTPSPNGVKPTTASSLDPDIVLLSDSWFSNFSSVPTNAPKTVEFFVDNTEDQMIDLTMNENDKSVKKVEQKDRKAKTISDDDLVVYYPINGEPFLSFTPLVEYASIVRTSKK